MIKSDFPIILASKSPRRKKLLEQINLKFEVFDSGFDEDSIVFSEPENYCQILALSKAKNVAEKLQNPSVVIGADTIVVLDNEILNKPIDEQNAYDMLKKLSGKTHTVYTGLAFVFSGKMNAKTCYQKTEVTFRVLEDDEINEYIKSGSPLDKAGAYGIQDDYGAVFVNHIVGCYYNIVGLPLELFYTKLNEFLSHEF